MPLVLMTATGRIDPERIEAFQVTFPTDPEIWLADVSAFLQAPAGRQSVAVERPALQNEERPTGSREGSEDAGSVGE